MSDMLSIEFLKHILDVAKEKDKDDELEWDIDREFMSIKIFLNENAWKELIDYLEGCGLISVSKEDDEE